MTDQKIIPIPDLAYIRPNCSVCTDGGDISFDDNGFQCGGCGMTWDNDGTGGGTRCKTCARESSHYVDHDGVPGCPQCFYWGDRRCGATCQYEGRERTCTEFPNHGENMYFAKYTSASHSDFTKFPGIAWHDD